LCRRQGFTSATAAPASAKKKTGIQATIAAMLWALKRGASAYAC
jgi:hypothetical protein